jgi:hypothetical protein
MKLLGYWAGEEEQGYPNPCDLVRPGWAGADLELLIRYLTTAPMFRGYWGHSSCRFRCGIDDTEMGSRELTDGEWVWPEGLAHYVERHAVVLPEIFIEHCRSRGWQPTGANAAPDREADDTFWRAWASETTKANKARLDNRP